MNTIERLVINSRLSFEYSVEENAVVAIFTSPIRERRIILSLRKVKAFSVWFKTVLGEIKLQQEASMIELGKMELIERINEEGFK